MHMNMNDAWAYAKETGKDHVRINSDNWRAMSEVAKDTPLPNVELEIVPVGGDLLMMPTEQCCISLMRFRRFNSTKPNHNEEFRQFLFDLASAVAKAQAREATAS